MRVFRVFRIVVVTVLAALLAACVTTTEARYNEKQDKEKALEISGQLARNYISKGEWEMAKRHLRYAIETDPDNVEALEGLALVFQNTGELELAEENYHKALKYGPDNTRVRNNYAVFLFSLERYEESAKEFNRVAEDVLYEGRLNAFLNLGRCYEQLDKPKEAAATYKRAFLMDKESVSALFGLASTYFDLGDYPGSQAFYDQFKKYAAKQTAASLWLGIRLADKFGDSNALASYALALKSLYPKSREYLEYKAFAAAKK